MVSINKGIPHIATHNGRHNHVKDLVLVLLYDHRYYYHKSDGFTRWELVRQADLNPAYLAIKLKKWCEWKYITKKLNRRSGRELFRYVIAIRGVNYVRNRIPRDKLIECRLILKEIAENT